MTNKTTVTTTLTKRSIMKNPRWLTKKKKTKVLMDSQSFTKKKYHSILNW